MSGILALTYVYHRNGINLFTVGVDILLEFLEVAFHYILFSRKIYPKEIFVKRKIYGITVHVSEHPELNEYLSNILSAIRELIKEDENSVKTVNLIFYNKNELPIEKFVFDIVKLQADLTEYVCKELTIDLSILTKSLFFVNSFFFQGEILII